MKPNRMIAKDYLKHISTKNELNSVLDSLSVSDEAKDITFLIICKGYTHTMISIEKSMSVERSKKLFSNCLDKIHF